MKKLFILSVVLVLMSSCSSLVKTSTYTPINVATPMTAIMADLEVSSEKINYLFIPGKKVRRGGYDNIVNCAVQEALKSNGNADVLVGLEVQVKYKGGGKKVESIVVTGYPAKYVNFRSPGDDYIREVSKQQLSKTIRKGSIFSKFRR